MASKELLLWCLVLVCLSGLAQGVQKPPTVQVYSRYPVTYGQENILQCFAEGFHPPKITITLMKNNVPIPDVKQSDLSFKEDWTFQLLAYAQVVPNRGDEYSCVVDHKALEKPITVKWEY
ncbi:beta-2-microglobulin [Erythrolamprus reginae]|uniref:beta-2-microglobulin n=1 Tax=Erythrolamprus reginae TaxID=121349 RepID=UPI00396CD9C8